MKQIKLLGVLVLALSLGLGACNIKGNEGGESQAGQVSECAKHDWGEKVTIKEPTCTEAGESQRTCKVCGAKEDPKAIKALGHDWEDDATGAVAPTCTEKGSKNQTCKRCNAKQTVDVKALGHDWVDDETGGVAPTCTQAGSKNQHCSRCTATQEGVEVPALGHDYGEWTVVEGKAPKCEEPGEEKRSCSRCDSVETREVAALGHNFVLSGDDTEPEAGKAKVRLYTCANGCGQTSLGFKASEVSNDSKSHLNFTKPNEKGEIGASFWGRPIGNAIALKADGSSVAEQDNECVYCSTETGDFFEYVFDLTAEQAAQLATCRCYCDAMPADHLSGDFWAYNATRNTDWTPGFYIDGADEHVEMENGEYVMIKDHALPVRAEDGSEAEGVELDTLVKKGKRIDDFRYILYVDGEVKQFDKSISVQVQSNTRKEYVMPFTFNLHEGTNRISLRMAGGYRSTFYNFTFRPYVEPTPIVVNETSLSIAEGKTAQITSEMTGLTYKSSSASVCTVDETGLVTGVKAGTATITVSKTGNYKAATVAVTVTEKEGVIALDINSGVIAPSGGITLYESSRNGNRLINFQKDATLTFTFNSALAGAFDIRLKGSQGGDMSQTIAIKVNDANVAVSGTLEGSTYSPVELVIGQATLKAGENTLVITVLADGSSLVVNGLSLIPHE